MLQVEKKKTGKNRKWKWLIAVLLCVLAAAAGILLWTLTREKPAVPRRTRTGGSLINRETSEIQWVRIQARGREPWSAKRGPEGKLIMEGQDGWHLDEILSERLEDALAHLVYEDILTEDRAEYGDRLAEFGLAEPALIAETLFSDGFSLTIRIGDDSGMEDEDFRFMTVDGDPRLYAVAGSVMEDLNVEPELLHPVVQPEIQISRVDRITILDGNGKTTAEWDLHGEITDSDAAENWQVIQPVRYPADQDQIASLKKNVGNLRLGLYIGEGTAEALSEYGLERPAWEILIHMAAGTTGQITESGAYDVKEWPDQTVRFQIGSPRNEMTDYCLYEGVIYTMNHFTAAALTEINPVETLARYPVTVAQENLSSLEIRKADGSRTIYELTRSTKQAASENDEPETAVACLRNGEEMDYSVFEAAYERLRVVNVSGQLPDGWQKKETREEYVFRTLSGAVHTVELSEFDAMHDAVTVDGWTLFYLIRGGLDGMP